ncbi:hypothetical protein [uncultured Enterococcus sp.]|uniref:hypothetical protein n=1 Tax=uncultured Enterococcus sp. TaxID=167972 RepID=UPI002009E250|nr:hypothetical protein [Enterococcus cecorum]
MKKNLLTLLGIFVIFSLASLFWMNMHSTHARLMDSKKFNADFTLEKGNVVLNSSFSSSEWRYLGQTDDIVKIQDVPDKSSYQNRQINGDLIGKTRDGDRTLGVDRNVAVLTGYSFDNMNAKDTFLQRLDYQYVGKNTASCSAKILNSENLSADFEYYLEVYVTDENGENKTQSYSVITYNKQGNRKLETLASQNFDIQKNQKVNLLIKIRLLKGEVSDSNGGSLSTLMKVQLNAQNKLVKVKE